MEVEDVQIDDSKFDFTVLADPPEKSAKGKKIKQSAWFWTINTQTQHENTPEGTLE